MPNKMLIDATHPEETRVVVLRGNRVEEFDFESAQRKQLRGNIYLAKVTRVEPSLQAAFVEYGGNRHGFLAFSEIHPDYYQIPVADRQALIEDEERAAREAEEESENRSHRRRRHRNSRRRGGGDRVRGEAIEGGRNRPARPLVGQIDPHGNAYYRYQPPAAEDDIAATAQPAADSEAPPAHEISIDAVSDPATASGQVAPATDTLPVIVAAPHEAAPAEEPQPDVLPPVAGETAEPAEDVMSAGATAGEAAPAEDAVSVHEEAVVAHDDDEDDEEETAEEDVIESVGGDDAMEEVPERTFRPRRQYKIQEVIKRRQVMLIQVVKEERGNKGAALTTYLSLAGRYAVLMPNTARGGGISRKITSSQDRNRLKEVVQDLDVPEGMGVILRTAGAARTQPEIKRDFEYLLRAWEQVRDLTLKSTAPTLVYEEGSLIKRSIRDLFNKEIDEVMVAGEGGYTEARDFMKMLMPSAARAVKLYRENQPLFSRMGIESQLDAMFSPTVQLRSGGYIVINQTEALVSIDVNSGRSTREHHIEDTALKTNLEAAEEVARQLRLRDLAGLIVIDFIDMDEKRNNRAVERKLSDCLKHDRARIQVGRISHFGLLEMSRQRIRASVLESSTEPCPHCGGTGHVRSVSSVALQLLRGVEEVLMKGATHDLVVRTRTEVALYVLNHKRGHLRDLEEGFQVSISVLADGAQQSFVIEHGEQVHTLEAAKALLAAQNAAAKAEIHEEDDDLAGDETDESAVADESEGQTVSADIEDGSEDGERRRRRKRRRRGGRDAREASEETEESAPVAADSAETEASEEAEESAEADDANGEDGANGRRRRRGRRGGRRRRGGQENEEGAVAAIGDDLGETAVPEVAEAVSDLDGDVRRIEITVADSLKEPAAVQETVVEETPVQTLAVAEKDQPQALAAVEVQETEAAQESSAATRRRSTVREKVVFKTDDAAMSEPAAQPRAADAPASGASSGTDASVTDSPATVSEAAPEAESAPRRAGWWSRRFGGG
ncbi:MAG: Rne/Rng family ribonuclease [Xanthobacteraceae bacterium]